MLTHRVRDSQPLRLVAPTAGTVHGAPYQLAENLAGSDLQEPKLQFLISRGNGVFVPLVPADELPDGVHLRNVPRTMDCVRDFSRFRQMECLGEFARSGKHMLELTAGNHAYSRATNVNSPRTQVPVRETASVQKRFLAPDAMIKRDQSDRERRSGCYEQNASSSATTSRSQTQHRIAPAPTRPSRQVAKSQAAKAAVDPIESEKFSDEASDRSSGERRRPQEAQQGGTQAIIDAIIAANPSVAASAGYKPNSKPPPSGVEPDQEKKEYCTYWIRTGECDYTQQGCLYKHEMPDKSTLQRIGFRIVPRWWQERNALRIDSPARVPKPLTWIERRLADSENDADSEGSEESDEDEQTLAKVELARAVDSDGQHGTTPSQSNLCKQEKSFTAPNDASSGELIDFTVLEPMRESPVLSSRASTPASVGTTTSNRSTAAASPQMTSSTSSLVAAEVETAPKTLGGNSPASAMRGSPLPNNIPRSVKELTPPPAYKYNTIFATERDEHPDEHANLALETDSTVINGASAGLAASRYATDNSRPDTPRATRHRLAIQRNARVKAHAAKVPATPLSCRY